MGEENLLKFTELQKKQLADLSILCKDLFGVTFIEFEESFEHMSKLVAGNKSKRLKKFFYLNVLRNSLVYEICYTAYRHYIKSSELDLAASIWHGVNQWI